MKNQQNKASKKRNSASCWRASLLMSVCLALLLVGQASAGVAVIVAPGSNLETLSRSQLKAIFLGKVKRLPNGDIARPANQENKSPVFDAFNKKVLGKNSGKVLKYWAARVFSGKGIPPRVVKGDQAMIDFVRSEKGAIGYIDSASVSTKVKALYSTD